MTDDSGESNFSVFESDPTSGDCIITDLNPLPLLLGGEGGAVLNIC